MSRLLTTLLLVGLAVLLWLTLTSCSGYVTTASLTGRYGDFKSGISLRFEPPPPIKSGYAK